MHSASARAWSCVVPTWHTEKLAGEISRYAELRTKAVPQQTQRSQPRMITTDLELNLPNMTPFMIRFEPATFL